MSGRQRAPLLAIAGALCMYVGFDSMRSGHMDLGAKSGLSVDDPARYLSWQDDGALFGAVVLGLLGLGVFCIRMAWRMWR